MSRRGEKRWVLQPLSRTAPAGNLAFLLLLLIIKSATGQSSQDPTHGFTEQPFDSSKYRIQKPYDLPVSQRYSFKDGVHKLWVYSTDKPFKPDSPTKPRTEIMISGYKYSSGVWQFEGYAYVPSGTSGVSIMQVFGASPQATTLMLRVYDGNLTYYRGPVVAPNIYNRWIRVNVIHDVDASELKVYIDGTLAHEAAGRGGTTHYFKFGVYAQDGASNYMESRWKGIRVLKKIDETYKIYMLALNKVRF